jgi:hypothetical protein
MKSSEMSFCIELMAHQTGQELPDHARDAEKSAESKQSTASR